jgi:serine/threonine protein kinase
VAHLLLLLLAGTVFAALLKGTQVAVKCLELIPEGSSPNDKVEADALKQCNSGGSQQESQQEQQQLLQLLKREASMMLASQHPNIVRCLGVSLDEKPAIVMELCSSGSLHHALHRPQFTPLRVLKLLHDVACAMSFLHAAQDAGPAAAAAAAAPPSPRSFSSSQLSHSGLGAAAAAAAAGPGSRRGSSQRLNSGSLLASVLHCDLRAPNLLLSGLRPDSWTIKVGKGFKFCWVLGVRLKAGRQGIPRKTNCASCLLMPAVYVNMYAPVLQVTDFGLAQWTGEDGKTALTNIVTNLLPTFCMLVCPQV